MTFPKTMLFTPTPPGRGSVGENYLQEVVKVFPKDKICCFAAWSTSYAVWVASPEIDWLDMETVELPNEHLVGRVRGPKLDQLHSFLKRGKHWKELSPIVDRAVQYGKERNVEVVFAILASPSTVMMAREVAKRLNAKMVALVWDPPSSTMKILGFDPFSMRKVMEEYEQVLRACVRCVVASEGMREDFFLKLGVKSSVLTRPIEQHLRQSFKQPEDPNRFVIAFAGSIYAAEEMKALIWTLGKMGWEVNGKQIVLRILGNNFNLPIYAAGKKACLEFLGHRHLEEAIEIISKADLGYLPYWFDKKFTDSVRTCFPDKLVSYLTAGVPILYHGPEDSSPTRFLERYPAGICCHSLDNQEIERAIRKAAEDPTFRERAYQASARAQAEELNAQVFAKRIVELLEINPSELAPSLV